jgi:hypothetical protein
LNNSFWFQSQINVKQIPALDVVKLLFPADPWRHLG